jgi:hypothetical protein
MTISKVMRDVLIEHIDGRPVRIKPAKTDRTEHADQQLMVKRKTIHALIERGYLETVVNAKSCDTVITTKGREELCAALADWAEALVAARKNMLNNPKWREGDSLFRLLLEQFSTGPRIKPPDLADKS